MEENWSRVYALTDGSGRIVRIEGEYTLPADLTGWALIEEGTSCDRLNLAQSLYLPEGLMNEDGIYRWKLSDGKPVLRSAEEIAADRAAMPVPVQPPSNAELAAENALLKAQIEAQSSQMDFYEDCIAEMAAVVYA